MEEKITNNIEKLIGAENKSREVEKISFIEVYFSNKLNNKNYLYVTQINIESVSYNAIYMQRM